MTFCILTPECSRLLDQPLLLQKRLGHRSVLFALDIHLGYEDDTIAALKKSRPDWVIWPETSLTGRILRMDDGTWAMPSDNLISIDRVREAGNLTLILGLNELEGEMHGDAALSEEIRNRVYPDSRLKGQANLLVMPNLDAANISFNLLKMTGGEGLTIGPILLGAAMPVHILTPSTTVRRLVNMTALAVVDAGAAR